MSERHCWKDKSEWAEETYGIGSPEWADVIINGNATCMLPTGHEGEHDFVDDGQIGIAFLKPGEDL